MRTISFNKHRILCVSCGKNAVRRLSQSCDECRAKSDVADNKDRSSIGSKMPAAVVTTESGEQIFVDKNGQRVSNHGYDIENDPRGHKRNGAKPQRVKTIL